MDRLAAPSDQRPPPVTSTAERCNARPVEPLEVRLDAETLPPPLTVHIVTLEVVSGGREPPLYLVERLWRGSVGAGCSPRRVGLYPPVT